MGPHASIEEAGVPLGLYPIRVVAAQTGLGVHTLRAWERRYGLPRPSRTAGEHRLYRREDILLLRRVQGLIAAGTPPSRACALVLAESEGTRPAEDLTGFPPPASAPEAVLVATPPPSIAPAEALCLRMQKAFVALDEERAGSALCEAFSLYGPELALERVVLPVLAEIGAAWAGGRVSVAAEHFATALIRARLLAALDGSARTEGQPVALLGAAPGDQHEIPPMALALLLRRRGWRAIFLGADIPLDALRDAIVRTHPVLVCLSAALHESARGLIQTLSALHGLPECSSLVLAYGGAPFRDNPALRRFLEGVAIYLGDDLCQATARAQLLLRDGTLTASTP